MMPRLTSSLVNLKRMVPRVSMSPIFQCVGNYTIKTKINSLTFPKQTFNLTELE